MGVPFAAYGAEIYLNGLAGERPALSTDPARLEAAARSVLDDGPFGYVAGGAGGGATMRANRAAFDRYGMVPRMLRDTTERDWSTTLLGTAMPAPLLLAPIGVMSIVHPDGELAVARAGAELGVPMVLSTASSHTIEEVAAASGDAPRWYQLYWPTEDAVTVSILERARAAGHQVLVVTLDTWTLGWRPHDLDLSYLPFLRGVGTAIPFSDPAFRAGLAAPPEEDLMAAVGRWVPMFTGAAVRWDRLDLLREHWDGPIVLKGVQHVDDALHALEAGMDGIVVSNHGGRQVDRAIGSLDALPGIVAAVDGRAAVLFDSGIRSGADAAVALALGADAVLLGRPYVYGLALGGQDGVRHVLRSVLAELDLTLALSGFADLAQLRGAKDAVRDAAKHVAYIGA
ncbi:lactate 2-monooxygenase [Pseudonocardia cypriaca]|uniref:Isopentenyl diphosphate isomerase/L-lactate dehydrogenase-like FMN-dependent dehydrogenase n=1 Tax=Pseudonocardia cypriaca TaxID=882449 RepID=A0A543GHD0_9PSEU|nr:lactate 2-monooxygenase [Pseudonocardia cypriaca]TQM45490.1 isopentenyl diphosphate isomerase/L-lactate dehydrogenase-like FMN-dependent dehydrogenase [Pseudonocardia cypriaca]